MANGDGIDLSQIATALQGFGAGVSGQLPQFLQQQQRQQALTQQQEQQRLQREQDRQKTLFSDAQRGLSFANRGDFGTVGAIAQERLRAAPNFPGVDFSDTQRIFDTAQLAQQGDAAAGQSLIAELQEATNLGIGIGVLEAPEGAEEFTLSPGQQRFRGREKIAEVLPVAKVSESGKASAVTKIFDNGTVIQALPNGLVSVKDPSGQVVTGQLRIDALQQARKDQVALAQTKAGAKEAGEEAVKLSTKTFERLENIRPAIENINEAIRLVDEGAGTGTIVSKLPSIRSASKQLDNVQARMGLDVIRNTTFGALSEAELQFALSSALPKNLSPKDLRRWLSEKRDSQEKLSSYLQDVAIFLGTPGNTVAGWLEAQKELQTQDQEVTPAVNTVGRFQVEVLP